MGREILSATPDGAFRVPITKEPSVNERPSVSEVTRAPSAIEGMTALGEMIHRNVRASYERAMSAMNRERNREFKEISHQDPENLSLSLIEDAEAGADEVLQFEATLKEHEGILVQRTEGRAEIANELERTMGAIND